VIVVAAPDKIAALGGHPLRVDTGDPAVDRMLCGYVRVITGYHEYYVVHRVAE
jgi:predicted polyphosphate/ATP-dependent NAD kinase